MLINTIFYVSFLLQTGNPSSISSLEPNDEKDCTSCHDNTSLEFSIHESLNCKNCHLSIKKTPHGKQPANLLGCNECHVDETKEYLTSVHGKLAHRGKVFTALCWECHGDHDIVAVENEESLVHPLNQHETCGNCHKDPEFHLDELVLTKPVEDYEQSVHAQRIIAGNYEAATCNDCHGDHDIQPIHDGKEHILKGNTAKKCSHCHTEEYARYSESIHWKTLQQGKSNAPQCMGCHYEHAVQIQSSNNFLEGNSTSSQTCIKCHLKEKFINIFGLKTFQLESYVKSFHGLSSGDKVAESSNCSSCHEIHRILSKHNPKSKIHYTSLESTCGTCHPAFLGGRFSENVHATPSKEEMSPIFDWIKRNFIWIFIIVLSLLLIYGSAKFVRQMKNISR